ncbi:MAG: PAS domain-containing protein [Verrucomicrobia bacterium]|nr:PAS domain-containing protein [Verrucomicrobiota bacterium]
MAATASEPVPQPIDLSPGADTNLTVVGLRAPTGKGAASDDQPGAELQRVLALLRRSFGADFTWYDPATIQRRVLRRMSLLRIDQIENYARLLHGNEAELVALYQDILLKVSSFFRDPDVFDFLQRRVFPHIFKRNSSNQGARLWVPGCSTGEEAYSLAICLSEYLGRHRVDYPVQIFATDLSEAALNRAREGIYPEKIASDVSGERLRRFFTHTGRSYRIAASIRERIVFAQHNLAKDPPFSRLDLISCRNVLSALDAGLQRKIGSIFFYALRPGGHLVLGTSENAREFSDLFTPLDQQTHVLVRKINAFGLRAEPPVAALFAAGPPSPNPDPAEPPSPSDQFRGAATAEAGRDAAGLEVVHETNRLLIQRYAPPGVVVNSHFDVIQFHGQGHAYLEPAYGKASFSLLKLIKAPLAIHVRTLMAAARTHYTPQTQRVTYREGGITQELELEVVPLRASEECHFLILFHRATPGGPASEPLPVKDKPPETDRLGALLQELTITRQHLQRIIKEQDAANEEIRGANEEIRSSNEELQATNEELEAAKEELQSSNDELATINEELQIRNDELASANNDLINLVNSINFAILMLGNEGHIRRFTATAARLFNLIPTDVGRPFSDVRSNLQVPDLSHLVDEVIQTVASKEREVQDKEGRWYSMSIRPYRTSEHKIDGAVICLVDIDDLKRSIEAFKRSRDFSQAVVETVREPLVVLDSELRVRSANAAFYAMFGASSQETLGRLFHTLADGGWNIPRLRRLLVHVLETGNRVQDFVVEQNFRQIGRKRLLLNSRRIEAEDQTPSLLLLAIEDITEKRRVEQQVLAVSERERRRMAQELHDGLGQHLTAITFVAQTIHHQLQHRHYAEAAQNAEQLVSQVSEATELTRDLAKGLHPMQVQAGQFQTAMETLAHNVSSLFKVVCTFSCDQPCMPPAESDEKASQLYRITQEAINNALKHGKATRIAITYKHDPQTGRARLLISDDGSGSPKPADPGQIPGGMGLQIMRYRAESIGGKFQFDQAPDGGTVVMVSFGEDGDER